MASAGATLFAGVFVLVGAAIALAGLANLRSWWTMRRMDPSGALSIEPGLGEFEGRAQSVGDTVTAPFSGAESLVCEFEVERYRPHRDGSNWNHVDGDQWAVPFELRGDAGQTVAVNPGEADTLLTEEFHVDTAEADALPDRVREYVDEELDEGSTSLEVGPIEIGGNRRYRFTEQRLDAGEEVYVLGPVERDPDAVRTAEARYAVAPPERGWRERLLGTPFVVADTGEETAQRRQLKRGAGLFLFGALFAAIPLVLLVAG